MPELNLGSALGYSDGIGVTMQEGMAILEGQPFSGLNGLTFSPETCGGVASIQSFLKALLRRHPHHHTSNPSPCSSGLLLC